MLKKKKEKKIIRIVLKWKNASVFFARTESAFVSYKSKDEIEYKKKFASYLIFIY